MADPTDRDADRLDEWLNADGRATDGDDLIAFAGRLLREAALPHQSDALTVEQRERIRVWVLGGAPTTEKARPTVHAATLAPNGTTAVPLPRGYSAPSAPSKLAILITAALVALIVVGGLGVLGGAIGLSGGRNDQAPTVLPALAWSPVASPVAKAGCAREQMVSVFEGEAPEVVHDTAHATLNDGTLTWRCGGESEVLATHIRSASGVFWPGVISLLTGDGQVRLLNIVSGTSIDLDGDLVLNDDGQFDSRNTVVWSGGPEPWVAMTTNVDRTDWRIIDVRTMETLLVSDDLGGPLPEPSKPDFGQITGTDVAVITWRPENARIDGTPFPGGVKGLAQERALVLPGSIEERRWIEIAEFRDRTVMLGSGFSQRFSVRADGRWIAYPTLTDTSRPAIRVEDAVSGDLLADVAIDDIDRQTRFVLAGDEQTYLIATDGETMRIVAIEPNVVREIATLPLPGPDVLGFLPTSNPDTVLVANSGTSVTPVDARSGEQFATWQYVPPAWGQVFGTYELPRNIVRVVSAGSGGTPSIIEFVNPATGEVVLESDPVDAHPIQIVSFTTWLRNGGDLAVVPIGYNRAVVMNAATGKTWQIAAPAEDERLWHFFPSYDGMFVTAYPEPRQGTTSPDRGEAWIAPLEPGAEWVPLDSASAETAMLVPGTPAG